MSSRYQFLINYSDLRKNTTLLSKIIDTSQALYSEEKYPIQELKSI